MIRYFTSWYSEKNEDRRKELITCIQKCCDSPDIDKVYLICEAPAPFMHEKMIEVPTEHRYTYQDFFLVANGVSEINDLIIISNSDIFPAEGIRNLLEQLQSNQAWALSRWDIQENREEPVHHNRSDSMDTWCFRAPIKNIQGAFCLGVAGCDNKIAYNMQEAGYEVGNPSREIRFYHLHHSGIRHYNPNNPVPSPYLLVAPHLLSQHPSGQLLSIQPTVQNPITPQMRGQ